MAASTDCFTLGSIVKCTTCFGKVVEGEVVAFENTTRLLIIKSPSKNTKSPDLCDMNILNLSLCRNIELIEEADDTNADPDKVGIDNVKDRLEGARRYRQACMLSGNPKASLFGQELYLFLHKLFNKDDVIWNDSDIRILDQVLIKPPYKKENIKTISETPNDRLIKYIEKVLDRVTVPLNETTKDEEEPKTETKNSQQSLQQSKKEKTKQKKQLQQQVEQQQDQEQEQDQQQQTIFLKSQNNQKQQQKQSKNSKIKSSGGGNQKQKNPGGANTTIQNSNSKSSQKSKTKNRKK